MPRDFSHSNIQKFRTKHEGNVFAMERLVATEICLCVCRRFAFIMHMCSIELLTSEINMCYLAAEMLIIFHW